MLVSVQMCQLEKTKIMSEQNNSIDMEIMWRMDGGMEQRHENELSENCQDPTK